VAGGEKVGDFRRILRFGSDLSESKSYHFEDSVFEKIGVICDSAETWSGIYRRFEDSSLVVVKLFFLSDLIDEELIETKITHLMNLYHPCILPSIGFVLAGGSRELKVLGLYSESLVLVDIIRASPAWWTPTAKAKSVAGLVLGLRFVHSLGLIHGCLTTNSVLFDSNHCIQITDFLKDLSQNGLSGFSSEEWNPETDIRGFMSILFEIVVGRPANDETDIPAEVPKFVSEMIQTGLSGERRSQPSFCEIFETLKQHDFKIVPGVHPADVLAFVDWVELLEQSC
jgi:serine/threonine protein kinase